MLGKIVDGTDTIFNFSQGSDTFNFAHQAGKPDPVVSISLTGSDTDVHVRWYDTAPVDGQALPAHQDADILLHGVALTTFVQGHDYFIV
jgi:hypothetical protein